MVEFAFPSSADAEFNWVISCLSAKWFRYAQTSPLQMTLRVRTWTLSKVVLEHFMNGKPTDGTVRYHTYMSCRWKEDRRTVISCRSTGQKYFEVHWRDVKLLSNFYLDCISKVGGTQVLHPYHPSFHVMNLNEPLGIDHFEMWTRSTASWSLPMFWDNFYRQGQVSLLKKVNDKSANPAISHWCTKQKV